MAYSAPPQNVHGDYPTAANLTKYSDGLTAIYNAVSGKSAVWCARTKESGTDANSFYTLVHVFRWLFYTGEGTLTNVAQNETTSLPDGGSTNIFDLNTVDWLTYGMPYRITGVDFALEDWEP